MGLYFSYENIDKANMPFNIALGARGTGKTYTRLLEDIFIKPKRFIYMRTKQVEIDMLCSDKMDDSLNPFKRLSKDKGVNITTQRIAKNVYGAYMEDNFLGYLLALSTLGNIRGFDASDVDVLTYDECIPTKSERKNKYQAEDFYNAYETINRNREFEGNAPLKAYLLSNSNDFNTPLIHGLGIMKKVESMKRKGQSFSILPERGLTITYYSNEEFKAKKSKTALYKLTKGTAFSDMALDNEFAYDDFSLIQAKKIKEYKPLCIIGNICIYSHKNRYEYYASHHMIDCDKYDTTEQDVKRFMMNYGRRLYFAFIENALFFENFEIKSILTDYIS